MSYWLTGLAANLFLGAIGISVDAISPPDYPRLGSMAIFLVFPIAAATEVWLLVGTWRSASKHVARGGKAFWATLARVGLALGWISSISALAGTAPMIESSASALAEAFSDPAYSITVSKSGDELTVRGRFAFGLTRGVERMLERHPQVTVIHFDSLGGRILEARELSGVIGDRGLATNARGSCFSACALAFLSGERRTISALGDIGFHLPKGYERASGPTAEEFRAIVEEDRATMESRGVDPDFVQRALSTPSIDMWRPSRRELFEAGVITELPAPVDHELALEPEQVEAELLQARLFRALKDHEPDVWNRTLIASQQIIARGGKIRDVQVHVRPLIMATFLRSAPQASDEVLLELARYFVDALDELSQLRGDECFHFMFQPDGKPHLITISREMLIREFELMARVIESGALTQHAIPQEIEVSVDLDHLQSGLVDEFGDDLAMLDDPTAEGVDRRRVCEISKSVYESALRLPPERSARLVRFLLASDSE